MWLCGLAVADWGLRFPARQRHAAHDAQRQAALGMTAASRSLSTLVAASTAEPIYTRLAATPLKIDSGTFRAPRATRANTLTS